MINKTILATMIQARKSGKSNDFFYDVAIGGITAISHIYKYGYNSDVPTDGYASIWNGGGEYTGFNAVEAQTIELFSSDDEDKPTGSGLGKVKLYGLDENYLEQTEEILLNGTTSVITTKTFIRCDRMKGLGDGTLNNLKVNQGSITARQSTTTDNIFAVMPIGHNSTMIACYTVPANKTALLVSRSASIAKKQDTYAEVRMKMRQHLGVPFVIGQTAVTSSGTSYLSDTFLVPIPLPPKTDICTQAGNASSSCGIGADFSIILQG